MALIDCKKCGNRVSDKAQACPKCGEPVEIEHSKPIQQPKLEEQLSSANENKNEIVVEKKSKVGLFCGIGILIVAIIVALLLFVPQLRFWEDTSSKSRSNSSDSDDIECCSNDEDELDDKVESGDFQKKEFIDANNSHGKSAVDLGLSVLWGEHNIGASSEQDYGNYYTYDNAVNEIRYIGKGWRLPTKSELEELRDNCDWAWTGSGYKVTGLNGNSIYLPAAGFSQNSSTKYEGELGRYWSSTMGEDDKSGLMIFNKSQIDVVMYYRNYGFSIRPVCDK